MTHHLQIVFSHIYFPSLHHKAHIMMLLQIEHEKREGTRPPFSHFPYPGITVLGSILCPFLCTLRCRCGAELLPVEPITPTG